MRHRTTSDILHTMADNGRMVNRATLDLLIAKVDGGAYYRAAVDGLIAFLDSRSGNRAAIDGLRAAGHNDGAVGRTAGGYILGTTTIYGCAGGDTTGSHRLDTAISYYRLLCLTTGSYILTAGN